MSSSKISVEEYMSLLGDSFVSRVLSELLKAEPVINKMYKDTIQRAYEDGLKKFSRTYEKELQSLFENAVEEFYISYTPNRYRRTYGLYNVADFYVDDMTNVIGSGGASDDTMSLFNENLMHPDRSGGGSLFETVFLEGYHGGAKYGEDHPEPGVAWWRIPGIEGRKGWYMPAYQTESPYEIFESDLELRADILQSKYTNTVQKSINEYAAAFAKEIPGIIKGILGS